MYLGGIFYSLQVFSFFLLVCLRTNVNLSSGYCNDYHCDFKTFSIFGSLWLHYLIYKLWGWLARSPMYSRVCYLSYDFEYP